MKNKFKKGDVVRHTNLEGKIDNSSVGIVIGYRGRIESGNRIVKVAFCFVSSSSRDNSVIASVMAYPEKHLSIDKGN